MIKKMLMLGVVFLVLASFGFACTVGPGYDYIETTNYVTACCVEDSGCDGRCACGTSVGDGSCWGCDPSLGGAYPGGTWGTCVNVPSGTTTNYYCSDTSCTVSCTNPSDCATSCCTDADGDGWNSTAGCNDGVLVDCDDNNPNTYPGATEICNGVDDNCDGEVDEVQIPLIQDSVYSTWYSGDSSCGYLAGENAVLKSSIASELPSSSGTDCNKFAYIKLGHDVPEYIDTSKWNPVSSSCEYSCPLGYALNRVYSEAPSKESDCNTYSCIFIGSDGDQINLNSIYYDSDHSCRYDCPTNYALQNFSAKNPVNGQSDCEAYSCQEVTNLGWQNICDLVDRLTCTASSMDIDISDYPLNYNYKWYIVDNNGDLTQVGSESDLDITVYDMNNTVFMCEVYATDGTDNSLVSRKSFTNSRDKNYIPFGVIETQIQELGPYSPRERIPKTVVVGTNEEFPYFPEVTCQNGECGNLDSTVLNSLLYFRILTDINFLTPLYGSVMVSDEKYTFKSISNSLYSSWLGLNVDPVYDEVTSNEPEQYLIQGKGDIPNEECTTFYEPYFVLSAIVNYNDGSFEEVSDRIIINESVESVVLNTEIYYDIPSGPISVSANSETIFNSEDLNVMNLCGNGQTNCFAHTPNSRLVYPAHTNLTATLTDANLSLLIEDSCIKDKLRGSVDNIEVEVEAPSFPRNLLFDPVYDNLCLNNFDNLPYPIYAKVEYFDGTFGDIYPSDNFTIELDTALLEMEVGPTNAALFESMVEVNLGTTTNKFGDLVQTVFIEKTSFYNRTQFEEIFSGVDPSEKIIVDIIGTYGEGDFKISNSTYFMINTTCTDDCVYYYTTSGRRSYYWTEGDLDLDQVNIIAKCGGDTVGVPVDYARVDLDFVSETTPGGIVLLDRFSTGVCGNVPTTSGVSSCYRVDQNGFYNMSISVDGTIIPYLNILATADCGFTSLSVLDPDYSANQAPDRLTLMKGESFEVTDLDISCSIGAEMQSSTYCKSFDAEDIFADPKLDLSINSENSALLSYTDYIAKVGNCGTNTVSSDFSFDGDSVSFCPSKQNDSVDFILPEEQIRDTRCSTFDESVRARFLGNHLISYAGQNVTTLGGYLANDTLNDYVQYIEDVIVRTNMSNFFLYNFLKNDTVNTMQLVINKDAFRSDANSNDVDRFIDDTEGFLNADNHILPQGAVEYLTLYDIKMIYFEKNSGSDYGEFLDDLENIINLDIEGACEVEKDIRDEGNGDFIVTDDLESECPKIALSIFFDPGVYLAKDGSGFEYCYVDWDSADTACCDVSVGSDSCVYNGICYGLNEIIPVDSDYVSEVCSLND